MFSKLASDLKQHLAEARLPDMALPELAASEWRMLAIFGCFVALLALEASFARREGKPKLYRQSYLANLGTLALNDTLLSLLSVTSLWWVAERFSDWGLLSALPDSFWKTLLSFLLLDLTLYFWHRANHRFEWLWMFHKVHHSDRVMNVSTAFRLHFTEVLLTFLVKALFIVALGVKAAVVVASETVITLFVLFHHANLSFFGERWLSRLTIVPSLHRVHHSVRREEHDSNFGAVFSWWDRMFGTLREMEPAEIGLRHVEGQNLWDLVKFGFTWNYGLKPQPKPLRAMIAEAAYYRAEKRGFVPGYEVLDWLEAEREIKGR